MRRRCFPASREPFLLLGQRGRRPFAFRDVPTTFECYNGTGRVLDVDTVSDISRGSIFGEAHVSN